jgi:hypothetical protein
VGPIEPGTIGKIHVEINTTHIRDSYNKEINVTTNDPNKGAFILTVNATVRETLSITPPYINLGSISVNSKISQPIKVENKGKSSVKITAISVKSAANLSITPDKNIIIKPGKTKDLMLKLDSGNSPSIIEGTISIKTNIPSLPEKIIPVRAEVLAR